MRAEKETAVDLTLAGGEKPLVLGPWEIPTKYRCEETCMDSHVTT